MIILATQSAIRKQLLASAGVVFEAMRSPLDEEAEKVRLGAVSPRDLATSLAIAKAQAVSVQTPKAIVIGADQTLDLQGKTLHKSSSRQAARNQLEQLRGQTHSLHSAVAVTCGQETLFQHCQTAELTMRTFSDDFLDHYISVVDENVLLFVGCYQIEALGLQLFDTISADYHTILGLPLLPLLAFLRHIGEVQT
jgi:septum formation protein